MQDTPEEKKQEQKQEPKNYIPAYVPTQKSQEPLDRISCPEPLYRISTTQDPIDQWILRRFNPRSRRRHR